MATDTREVADDRIRRYTEIPAVVDKSTKTHILYRVGLPERLEKYGLNNYSGEQRDESAD